MWQSAGRLPSASLGITLGSSSKRDSPFEDLPEVMTALASGRLAGLCHTLTYAEEDPCTP